MLRLELHGYALVLRAELFFRQPLRRVILHLQQRRTKRMSKETLREKSVYATSKNPRRVAGLKFGGAWDTSKSPLQPPPQTEVERIDAGLMYETQMFVPKTPPPNHKVHKKRGKTSKDSHNTMYSDPSAASPGRSQKYTYTIPLHIHTCAQGHASYEKSVIWRPAEQQENYHQTRHHSPPLLHRLPSQNIKKKKIKKKIQTIREARSSCCPVMMRSRIVAITNARPTPGLDGKAGVIKKTH